MTESAEFQESIDERFQFLIDDIHTFFPATITNVRPSGLVDIQPNVKVKFQGEESEEELPIITNVPLWETRSLGAIIRFPKEDLKGSKVGVFIAEHSLVEWRGKKGISTFPEEPRRFDINDAVAVLGLYPETIPWLVTQKPKTLEIQVKEGNKIGIGNPNAELLKIMFQFLEFFQTVAATDGDTLAANLTTAQTGLLLDLKTQLATITNTI